MADLDRLARSAAEGDRDALERFIAATQAEVWRFCAQTVGREHADDVTQETYLRAIGSLRNFRGDSSAKTWLLRIARNTCVDSIRRTIRRRSLIDRLSRRPIEPEAVDADHGARELHDLIAGLSHDRREAFSLTQILGLSYEEAAEVCGVPVGTIRSRVSRARQDLLGALSSVERAAPRYETGS